MARAVFHVVPADGQWQIEQNGQRVLSHTSQEVAAEEARELARDGQPSRVVIHDQDGKIREESTYGDDPFPPLG